MKKKSKNSKATLLSYDPLTDQISRLLGEIPKVGSQASRLYLWKPMMFNFMLVGASGTVLSWFLYEGFFRVLLVNMWGGTFIGMVITTILVFLWNFTWNKRWSLNTSSQIMKMKKDDLEELKAKIDQLLRERFTAHGERV